jgi:hypothetical protein
MDELYFWATFRTREQCRDVKHRKEPKRITLSIHNLLSSNPKFSSNSKNAQITCFRVLHGEIYGPARVCARWCLVLPCLGHLYLEMADLRVIGG